MKSPRKRIAFWCLLFLLTIFAIKGLVVVSQFIGYATFSDGARGGTITELVLQDEVPTDYWAGVYGIAVRVQGYYNLQFQDVTAGSMDEENLLFDCLEKDIEHELYAVTENPNTLSLSSLYPMTGAELDGILGKDPTDFDSATNTYTQQVTFDYGSIQITTAGTITYKLGEDPPITFRNAIVKLADNTPVYVAIITNFTEGFNNRTYNYQFLLPAPANETTRYYFFSDPNDVCGEGEGTEAPTAVVYGQVTRTTGVPLEGVIVEVGGVANITNSSGEYRIRAPLGLRNIFAVKEGFKVYHGNVTVVANNETEHNIILEDDAPANVNTGIGPGEDSAGDSFNPPSTGVANGEGSAESQTPVAPTVQQPSVLEGKDYIVSLTELNRKLRIGQFLQERVYIYSFKKSPVSVRLTINGSNISRLIKVDKNEMVLEPNSKGEFILTIFGVAPVGLFNGTLELEGDINTSIPVSLDILPAQQLPVEALHVEVETAQKTYYPRDVVRVKTDLRNMLSDQQYPVRLFFTVQSSDGNETIWTSESNVYLRTAFSIIKSFKVPSKIASGDYILRVTTNYLGFSSGTSTIFHVAVPFWKRTFLGLSYWLWFLILLLIGGGVGAFFYLRTYLESKKKFHLKVDYNELPKPGPRSIYVGKIAETDKTTYFRLENFKTHTIVAGSTGGGKSVSAQVIIEEALDKNVAVIVFDPTAQWTGMLRPCKDKMMLSLYPLFGMKKTDAKAFSGNIRQINDAREKIDIKKYVKPGEIQIFCGHKLDPKDMDIMVANAIREIFHANFPEEKLLKVMFVFDEVHRLLPKFGGSGDGFLQIERGCREFRKWGLGILLISQVLSDFVGTIKANINTEIQMRTRDEGDLERIRVKYGEDVLRSLVKATVGSGMVENPAYNRGKPYFVAFKPLKHSVERLSDEEIEQYNTYNDQIDDLFYSLDQLEELKIDVFDLKLELKLALAKVKTGNFNMVKIYLEGLKPRISSHWRKLGKQPKKLERELVDMSEISAELKKAEAEREKYVKAKEGEGGGEVAPAAKKEWGWKDDVTPDKILNLKNGMIVINLASLYDELSALKDKDLPNEFDPEPVVEEGQPPKEPVNSFADWVYDAIGDTKLANAMAATKTKEELLKLLETKRDGGEIAAAKGPDWFAKKHAGGSAPATPAAAPAPGAPATPATNAAPPSEAAPDVTASPSATSPIPATAEASTAAQQAATPAQGDQAPASSADATAPAAAEPQGTPTQPPAAGGVQPDQQPTPTPVEGQPAPQEGVPAAPAQPPRGAPEQAPLPESPAESQPTGQPAPEQQGAEVENPDQVASPQTQPPKNPQTAEEQVPVPAEQPAPQEERPAQPAQPVEAAKSSSSIDSLVVPDENQAFKLENGIAIKSVKELRDYIPQMDESIFNNHVGADYNHFADWIRGVFHEDALASKVASAHSKEELLAALGTA